MIKGNATFAKILITKRLKNERYQINDRRDPYQ
jgi:hypothetical protein